MVKRPNIVFLFSDQQHWEAAGFMDPTFATPNLDRVAGEGTVFTHAFCTTPQCTPSRASMLTGQYPTRTGVLGNIGNAGGEPLRTATIGAHLRDAGYHTAYFGKWHIGKDPVGTAGWDEDVGVTGPETRDDTETTRLGLDFLARMAGREKPFALFLSYNNPHDIYDITRQAHEAPSAVMPLPESWRRKDLSTVPAVQQQFLSEDQPKFLSDAGPRVWEKYVELYREKTALYDRKIGEVLRALDGHGAADNTLLIVTSDHGDMDAQHGLIFKGPFMYDHLVRVPLIIRAPASWPRRTPPGRVDFLTVNVDLASTLAEAAGIGLPDADGVSLLPFLTGASSLPQRDFVVGQYYSKQKWVNPIRMIRSRHAKYNVYRRHGEEYYDLDRDPGEIHNLAGDPAQAAAKADLAARLDAWMREHQDPFYTQHPTTRAGEPLP